MLDYDLAERYGVETKRLKEAVRRNIRRFESDDFMFELTKEECNSLIISLRSQNATLDVSWFRYSPWAFTELGVAMLSSVLNSDYAIDVNKNIMRAFVMIRQYALNYTELNRKIDNFMLETNLQFYEIYQALTELAEKKKLEEKPRNPIGFKASNERN